MTLVCCEIYEVVNTKSNDDLKQNYLHVKCMSHDDLNQNYLHLTVSGISV